MKNGTIDRYVYQTCYSWAGFTLRDALALRGFLQHLPAKYTVSEDQKKSYYLSAGTWHCAIWQIRRWLLHYVHKKFR